MNKKILTHMTLFLVFVFYTPASFATEKCDFTNDIKVLKSIVAYTYACHKEVGKIVRDNEDRQKIIQLQDRRIKIQQEIIDTEQMRVQMWKDTAVEMNERLLKHETITDYKTYGSFIAGVLVTVAAGFAVGAASK